MSTVLALLLTHAALATTGPGRTVSTDVETYDPVPLAVDAHGHANFDLPGGSAGRVYWLAVASLDRSGAKHRIEIGQSQSAEPQRPLVRAQVADDLHWQLTTAERRQEMRLRRGNGTGESYAAARVAEMRSFHLFVKEADFLEDSGYHEVRARLAACGQHCLIYLDVDDWSAEFIRTTVDDAVETFDKLVFPKARDLFGSHLDVDRDGKFTILFTHWLGQLSNGKVSLGGFVRGADFYRDVEPPLSNRCDMLYLNTNLKPGANLRSLLAHEYTHAITFSEHVFGRYLAETKNADDEAWLSEAIAHLAENLIGKGYSNLDHRVSTYLTAPERYRLVVPDYYRAGLWRCHGSRGATYLFLRWVVDRFGVGVLKELSQSNLAGVANIETATQTPFDELFRQWCVSTLLCGLDPAMHAYDYATLDLRARLESRQLAGANVRPLVNGSCDFAVVGTAMLPIEIRVAPGTINRIKVQAPNDAELQLTLIRMPDDLPLVQLAASKVTGPGRSVRLKVEQQAGAQVHWKNAAWELAFPPQNKAPEAQTSATVLACPELFSKLETQSGQFVASDPIDISRHGDRSVVVKVSGADAKGRRIAAWTVVTP